MQKITVFGIIYLLIIQGCSFQGKDKKDPQENISNKEVKEEPSQKVADENHVLPTKIPEVLPGAPINAIDPLPFFPPYFGGGGGGRREKPAVCGNGKIERRETCDDGNKRSFDGCTSECEIEPLFSVAQGDDQLRIINHKTGETLCQRTITLSNFTIAGANALATNPVDGSLWAILRHTGQNGARVLVTIDPITGVATLVGTPAPTGIAGLAFDDTGVLYAVTGDGGTPSETLFTLDTTDASSTLFLTLGNGSDGEAIAFNLKDKYLYHSSGRFNGPAIFERINLDTLVITPLWTSTETEEISSLVYFGQLDSFFAGNIDFDYFKITSSGEQVLQGATDHLSKGLAFSSPENSCEE